MLKLKTIEFLFPDKQELLSTLLLKKMKTRDYGPTFKIKKAVLKECYFN